MMIPILVTLAYLAAGVATARFATRKGHDADTATLALVLWPLVVAAAAWALTRWTLRWLATGSWPSADERRPTLQHPGRPEK